MRILRLLLQALLVLLYALLLPALMKSPFEWRPFAGVTVFFAFLFLLTWLLREYTANRLDPHRRISSRPAGLLVASAGLGLCFLAYRLAAGADLSSGRRGRLLASIVELVGAWPPAIVMLVLGVQMLYLATRLLGAKHL